MDEDVILIERLDKVALICLNRPAVYNALNSTLSDSKSMY